MLNEFKIYSLLLFSVPIAFITELIIGTSSLSNYELINATFYSLLCLASGSFLWKGKKYGYWVSFGLASLALEIDGTYFGAVYFIPNIFFAIGSELSEPPILIHFFWIPLAISLYLIFNGTKSFKNNHKNCT